MYLCVCVYLWGTLWGWPSPTDKALLTLNIIFLVNTHKPSIELLFPYWWNWITFQWSVLLRSIVLYMTLKLLNAFMSAYLSFSCLIQIKNLHCWLAFIIAIAQSCAICLSWIQLLEEHIKYLLCAGHTGRRANKNVQNVSLAFNKHDMIWDIRWYMIWEVRWYTCNNNKAACNKCLQQGFPRRERLLLVGFHYIW